MGEDGPTHQPIEHLASLRAMPGLRVIRPADANETARAWRYAIEHGGPTALVLSRQNVPVLIGTAGTDGLDRGAYVLDESDGTPDLVLIGTGSEVQLCLGAAEVLRAEGRSVRVVSMPCWELFEEQDVEYQHAVLGLDAPRLSVEAGSTFGWSRWADSWIGIDHFGASAPGAELMAQFGFTVDAVVDHARLLLD